MPKKVLFVLLILLLVVVVAVWSVSRTQAPQTVPASSAMPTVTAQPTEQPTAEAMAVELTPTPARGYVRITAGSEMRWFALPEEDVSLTVRRTKGEEEMVNIIHLTQNGVYMESSTCSNQDCVEQGEVTLENKDSRILSNMILCLPNEVAIELFTPEEILAMNDP